MFRSYSRNKSGTFFMDQCSFSTLFTFDLEAEMGQIHRQVNGQRDKLARPIMWPNRMTA